jgi:activating signal cointegrator 1
VKALSLTQPWASLVAIGAKRIETRSWSTSYRGRVAIHASKGFPRYAKDLMWQEPFLGCLREAGIVRFNIFLGVAGEGEANMPVGAVIATAALSDVWEIKRPGDADRWGLSKQEIAFGDYGVGRYAWFLRDIEPLADPEPAKGALGLWEWDTAIVGEPATASRGAQ